MGFQISAGGFGFGTDDNAEYQYKAVKHTNETSTRNLKLQLASKQQSEMRWMNFQEDQQAAWTDYSYGGSSSYCQGFECFVEMLGR